MQLLTIKRYLKQVNGRLACILLQDIPVNADLYLGNLNIMQFSKLKAINDEINGCFETPVLGKLRNVTGIGPFNTIECTLCQDVRRQNYALKQQLLQTEEFKDEIHNLKSQL